MYTGDDIRKHQEILKGNIFAGFGNDLEKAVDPTNGGKLIATHIIDKNGKHTVVYKTLEQVNQMRGRELMFPKDAKYNHIEELSPGHRVQLKDGSLATVTRVKGHNGKGMLYEVQDDVGKKSDKFVHNLTLLNPKEHPKVPLVNSEKGVPKVKVADAPIKDESKTSAEQYEDDPDKLTVEERWQEYRSKLRAIAKKDPRSLKSLIAYGSGGVGKTFTLVDTFDKMGLTEGEDYVKLTGAASAKGMFNFMRENSDKIIVFDDCDDVLKDENSVNILKSAADTSPPRTITWGGKLKPGETTADQTFPFTGKVVFISNLKAEDIPQPLKSRGERINLTMTKEETVQTIGNIIDSKRGLSFRNVAGNVINYSLEDKKAALDWVDSHKDELPELSVRTMGKVLAIKKFYGNNDWSGAAKRILVGTDDGEDINQRFDDYENTTKIVADGKIKSMIVYGTGGLGKTYTLVQALRGDGYTEVNSGEGSKEGSEDHNPKEYVHFKGAKISARALYERLHHNNGKLIIFDDSDSILKDPQAKNILKGALDTSGDGSVAWQSADPNMGKPRKKPDQKKSESDEDYLARLQAEGHVDENGEDIDTSTPKQFNFNGRVIFVSNLEKQYMQDKLQPLMSRALTTNMTMNADQTVERMNHLVDAKDWQGDYAVSTKHDQKEVINEIVRHKDRINLNDLNMRTLDKLVRIKVDTEHENANPPDEDYRPMDWRKKVKNELFQKAGIQLDYLEKAFTNLLGSTAIAPPDPEPTTVNIILKSFTNLL